MKRTSFLSTLLTGILCTVLQAQEVFPFYKVAVDGQTQMLSEQVKTRFEQAGFSFIGTYHPEGNPTFEVMAFTRDDLKKMTFSVQDRGALASVLKVGLILDSNNPVMTIVNPIYMFYAYLRNGVKDYTPYKKISDDFIRVLGSFGKPEPLGETLKVDKLKKYHYMMGMPYFDDPVILKTFYSFDQGLSVIRKNLSSGKSHTTKVYEIVDKNRKIAVFGVGLLDPEEGEKHFLPIIGESHLAAMPYEIILQGKEATMLHGRFRFALYWPGLTMKTFTKIMISPGDVEDMLKTLTE